jgi:hypothetical protein
VGTVVLVECSGNERKLDSCDGTGTSEEEVGFVVGGMCKGAEEVAGGD